MKFTHSRNLGVEIPWRGLRILSALFLEADEALFKKPLRAEIGLQKVLGVGSRLAGCP